MNEMLRKVQYQAKCKESMKRPAWPEGTSTTTVPTLQRFRYPEIEKSVIYTYTDG